ncbi:hypothetical protein BJX99DRAFT_236467 [Aspergillus californicus]
MNTALRATPLPTPRFPRSNHKVFTTHDTTIDLKGFNVSIPQIVTSPANDDKPPNDLPASPSLSPSICSSTSPPLSSTSSSPWSITLTIPPNAPIRSRTNRLSPHLKPLDPPSDSEISVLDLGPALCRSSAPSPSPSLLSNLRNAAQEQYPLVWPFTFEDITSYRVDIGHGDRDENGNVDSDGRGTTTGSGFGDKEDVCLPMREWTPTERETKAGTKLLGADLGGEKVFKKKHRTRTVRRMGGRPA